MLYYELFGLIGGCFDSPKRLWAEKGKMLSVVALDIYRWWRPTVNSRGSLRSRDVSSDKCTSEGELHLVRVQGFLQQRQYVKHHPWGPVQDFPKNLSFWPGARHFFLEKQIKSFFLFIVHIYGVKSSISLSYLVANNCKQ